MPLLTEKSMTFADYMQHALYGPAGYYASGRAHSGAAGDYFTAPNVGPALGMLLNAIFKNWQKMLKINDFEVIEAGAGEGHLGSLLNEAFRYTAVERSPVRQEKLRYRNFSVVSDVVDLVSRPRSGVLFGNELLDAFPVHRVRIKNGGLEELYLDVDGKPFWKLPSTPKLQAYFDRLNISLPEDYETEVNLAMADWFRSAAQALKQGLVVLIDYGRPAHEYYAPERNNGTLRGFVGHQVVDPLLRRGDFDLTADVDFTSAALDAKAAGFTPLAFMEMGSFLLEGAALLPAQEPAPKGLKMLLHPDGMGSQFQVLVLGKNVALTPEDFPHNRLRRLGL